LKIPPLIPFILCLLSFSVSLLALLKKWKSPVYFIIFNFLLLGFLFGSIAWSQALRNSFEGLEKREVTVEGIAEGDKSYRNEMTYFTLKVYEISVDNKIFHVNEKIMVKYRGKIDIFNGDGMLLRGVLLLPPGADNPGEFSYRDYLSGHGIHCVLQVDEENICFLDYRELNFFSGQGGALRRYFLDTISRLFPEPQASLLSGIVFGASATMPDKLVRDFQITGTYHMVAASGSNISMLLIIIVFLGELFRITYRRTAIICIPVVILYAFMVGGEPSIVRAAIMSITVLFGLIIEREPDIITSLFGAAFLILFINPLQIYDVGFQLSFVTVIAIVYFTPSLQKVLSFIPNRDVVTCISVSLAAQLGAAPPGVYYFNELSLVSPVANLLVFLFSGFSLMFGVIMLSIYPLVPFIAVLISRLLAVLLDYIIFINSFLAGIPYASVNMASPSLFSIFIYYVIVFFLASFIRDYKFWKRYFTEKIGWRKPAIALLGIALFFVWYPVFFPPTLKAVFLDVGQGDSIYLKLPDGSDFLIDGGQGGREDGYDAGKSVVVPFLKRQGVRELSGIILTHPDNDHMGGLVSVMKEFRVRRVFDGLDFDPSDRLYREFLFLVTQKGSSYYRLQAGNKISFQNGVKFEVLNPSFPLISGKNHLNENSLVLKISWKRVSFLMTGDIEDGGEVKLMEKPLIINSHILKVSHHGSKSSSGEDFLAAVTPEVSVISVGENNFYGHPSQEVLERLKCFSSPIYRTDRYGAVTVITDGKDFKVVTIRVKAHVL